MPNVRAMKARRLFPQPTPSLSYIAGAKSGNEKPHMVLTNAAAPVADAAYVYKSNQQFTHVEIVREAHSICIHDITLRTVEADDEANGQDAES